jgi:hypothetical protein
VIGHSLLAVRLLDVRIGRVLVNSETLVQASGVHVGLPARHAAGAAEGIAVTTKIEKHVP